MLVNYQLTKKDYYLSSFWTALTSRTIWLSVILIPFGFLVTILQPQSFNSLLYIVIPGLIAFLMIFIAFIWLTTVKKMKREHELLENPSMIELKSEGVFFFPKEGGKGIHSSFIFKFEESPWHFYLSLTPKHVILIPKKDLNVKEFRKLAGSLIINLSDLKSLIIK